ncbi:protein of unknown function [Formivibrio citricus]|uniref:DUF4337 domain-containing protein n=1 Tax=Formivibrio citricus TaxID=83765 RepID=A0A1I5A4P5_9NEIS|nr:DUF4337 domain-containing protein [Formivibrio citricus]SFN57387.1 protein of unknown function [Formivibrio citricus]
MENTPANEQQETRLNNMVGLVVLLLSVVMAFGKIKDDNIVQSIQQSKIQAVDTWNEYQAKKLKLHLAENNILLLKSLPQTGHTRGSIATLEKEVARYTKEAAGLQEAARGHERKAEELNIRDDQLDLAEALLSIAIALAGITAITRQRWMLLTSAGTGTCGLAFTVAAFAGWDWHPEVLIRFLT